MSHVITPIQAEGTCVEALSGKSDKESPYEDQLPKLDKEDGDRSHVQTIPWRYKLLAGSMILFFSFGSSLSETTLGPLKSTLVEELKITSKCVCKSIGYR
jgi:hypothetical protein